MADETRIVRTAGVYGTFVLPGQGKDDEGNTVDLAITPDGAKVTFDQWMSIAEAAEANQVVVRLDEDFPGELYAAAAEKKQADAPKEQTPQTGTVVDGTDTSTSGRRSAAGGAKNGG